MASIHDQKKLDSVRDRLYARTASRGPSKRTKLSGYESEQEIARKWGTADEADTQAKTTATDETSDSNAEAAETQKAKKPLKERTPMRRYRKYILIFSSVVCALLLGVASLFLVFGGNEISSDNIFVSVDGPYGVGGGEQLAVQVGVGNSNPVRIENAYLIVDYPPGTRSTDSELSDLYEERIAYGTIRTGESKSETLEATVFGEENQEQEIGLTLEYQIENSNGTFYKEIDPYTFQIDSSPLVMNVSSLETVSAGQELTATVELISNSPNPIQNTLVTAAYPNGFEFVSANPSPSYRNSEWIIDTIPPGETRTIEVTGTVSGQSSDGFSLQFEAGSPQPNNRFILGSIIANGSTDFVLEEPFIRVTPSINGQTREEVSLEAGRSANVQIVVENTLNTVLYDMNVEVALDGNALAENLIAVDNGIYDSREGVIRYTSAGNANLREIAPGETQRLRFNVTPNAQRETPSVSFTASAYARRVQQSSAIEQLVGTASSEVRYSATADITAQVGRGENGFTATGPEPPVVEETTTYTLTMQASAGGNDMGNIVVNTSLPQYVEWEDNTNGDGELTFNPVSKQLQWNVGDIAAGNSVETSFQVSITPSINQAGSVPTLLGLQQLLATDSFTGDAIRASNGPLNTSSLGEDTNGIVQGQLQSDQ